MISEYKCEFGGDWPLAEKEVSILDANQERLVDLLEVVDLLGLLHSKKVINKRQLELISSQQTSYKKNDMLLEILRRRSLHDYQQTIICLQLSNQIHIAAIFEEGGGRIHIMSYLRIFKSASHRITIQHGSPWETEMPLGNEGTTRRSQTLVWS